MAILTEGQSSVVAGPYIASWNGLALGQITPDGYDLTWQNSSYAINSDLTGEGTITDQIYNGTSCRISFTIQHWNAYAVESILWWMGNQGAAADYRFGHTNGPGLRHWDAAKFLVLESCFLDDMGVLPATSPNPTIDPLDITFPKTLLSNDKAVSFMLSTKPRYIPITMDIFPYSPGSTSSDPVERVQTCQGMRFWEATRNPLQPMFDPAAVVTAESAAPHITPTGV